MFVCLSRNDTPHIHLIILISVLSNFASCSTFIGHVSLPYNIQLLTQHLYILLFTASDAPLWARIGDISGTFSTHFVLLPRLPSLLPHSHSTCHLSSKICQLSQVQLHSLCLSLHFFHHHQPLVLLNTSCR